MLKTLKLTRYKGFRQFRVSIGRNVLLMGPNNAGKSTIINALRLCGAAGRVATRLQATEVFRDQDRWVRGFPLSIIGDDGFELGNIRHEFEEVESRLDLEWDTGATIHIVWPVNESAFFWVSLLGTEVTTPNQAKKVLSRIGLVPTLTPVERAEKKLSAGHLAKNVETRLSSRHFRNNLQAVKERSASDYVVLIDFLLANTPELTSLHIEETYREGAAWLDVFYRDPASHMLKEIYWAGDGLQIWLQLLFHVWRTGSEKTVILDEPDVFLHPDLQRRLVRVVESTGRQTLLSSHAAEVAAEVSLSSLVWVDRTRSTARRMSDDSHLEQFSLELGSAFNLSIARALRAKTALFVEGKDMKLLRVLARKVGARRFANDDGIAVIPIGGYSHWPSVEAFGWIKAQFLGSQVEVRLLLDSDYRSREEAETLIANMKLSNVTAHVWARKELENYLIEPEALARLSNLDPEISERTVDEVLEGLRVGVQSKYIAAQIAQKSRGEDISTTISRSTAAFELLWNQKTNRIRMCPAKDFISAWNVETARLGAPALTSSKLASGIRVSELDSEMKEFLLEVEAGLM